MVRERKYPSYFTLRVVRDILILWEKKKIKQQSLFIQYREMDTELNWGDIKVRAKN